MKEAYPKSMIEWRYSNLNGKYYREGPYTPTTGSWVYWDDKRLINCSRIDKDDNNAEINR